MILCPLKRHSSVQFLSSPRYFWAVFASFCASLGGVYASSHTPFLYLSIFASCNGLLFLFGQGPVNGLELVILIPAHTTIYLKSKLS